MKPELSTHTRRQLSYAEGYLALGMKKNAGEALAEIVGEDRTATPVLALGLTVRIEQGDWRRAAVIGKALCTRAPEVPGHWVQWAYATRRHVGILEARAILMRGLGLHPLEGMFHFNPGCIFKIKQRSATAPLRVSGKQSWAGVALSGTGLWPASASVALAEPSFPAPKHRFISKTHPGPLRGAAGQPGRCAGVFGYSLRIG